MGIGKKLNDILIEQKRNPNELAEKINESPSTIYSIIRRDNMKADISVLAKICQELGVSMEVFYDEYIQSSKNTMHLSTHEKQVIIAYRANPSMQEAVDRLLGVELEAQNEKRA